jgi:hypothetical protein
MLPRNEFVLKTETLLYCKNWVVVVFALFQESDWLVKWEKTKFVSSEFSPLLSERFWWFDLIWEGHQHRESLEQRTPIGENAIKQRCCFHCNNVVVLFLFGRVSY